jgi:hypothetical protein
MSHTALNIAGYSNTSFTSSRAVSDAANFVKEKIKSIAKLQSDTGVSQVSYGKTIKALEQIKLDYAVQNWGGDDEMPVDSMAIDNAADFLTLLQPKFHNPEVIPEADGSIAFEWRFGPFRSVIVAFSRSQRIEFSVLSSRTSASFGHCHFNGLVPLDIVRYLNSVGNFNAIS